MHTTLNLSSTKKPHLPSIWTLSRWSLSSQKYTKTGDLIVCSRMPLYHRSIKLSIDGLCHLSGLSQITTNMSTKYLNCQKPTILPTMNNSPPKRRENQIKMLSRLLVDNLSKRIKKKNRNKKIKRKKFPMNWESQEIRCGCGPRGYMNLISIMIKFLIMEISTMMFLLRTYLEEALAREVEPTWTLTSKTVKGITWVVSLTFLNPCSEPTLVVSLPNSEETNPLRSTLISAKLLLLTKLTNDQFLISIHSYYHLAKPKGFIWSTFCLCTWIAGVIHCIHEHFFPDQITSPIFVLHLGQLSLTSLVSIGGNQVGGSMK